MCLTIFTIQIGHIKELKERMNSLKKLDKGKEKIFFLFLGIFLSFIFIFTNTIWA